MRRLLSVMLLAVFGLPFVAPLLAGAQEADSALPACCRRAGKHHCAMGMMASSSTQDQAPRWTAPPAKCPCCPEAARLSTHHEAAAAAEIEPVAFLHYARPLGKAQTESRRRIARERSRHKRGPPSIFLA